jgi:hypothetical protein
MKAYLSLFLSLLVTVAFLGSTAYGIYTTVKRRRGDGKP